MPSSRALTFYHRINRKEHKERKDEGRMINEDLCNSGVAASRQRAALFNLLEKCGGLPTAATMKVKNEGRMMNDETSKRMEIGAPASGTACCIDYELRAVPEAGAPGAVQPAILHLLSSLF
jgi:hypothetical protein